MFPGGGYSVLVLITFPSFNTSQEGDHEDGQGPSGDLMIHKVIFTGSTEEDLQLAKVSRVQFLKTGTKCGVEGQVDAGFQVGFVFTYLCMFTYHFQKLGM